MLALYTIYDHPADYPDGFAVREWRIEAGGESPVSGGVVVKPTLKEARDALPLGVICIAKSKADDPTIVESWL